MAAGGLALGVMALILSLAGISGFQDALRSELLGRTPQIEVELPPEADAEAVRKVQPPRELALRPTDQGRQPSV